MPRALVILILCLMGGCAPTTLTNMPWSPFPTYEVPGSLISVQVDQNGDFYPDDWQARVGESAVARGKSLAMALPIEGRRATLDSFRDGALARVRHATAGRQRVFIIIHGFNAEPGSAAAGYAAIKQALVLRPTDAIIEIHWDGLTDAGALINGARIWFPSVTTSQQAGSHALRSILDTLENQEVVFITHSRGASVVLSAISNPNYRSEYKAKTEALLGDGFLRPTEIDFRRRGLRMNAVFLAPAIGNPDFWDSKCIDTQGCQAWRPFPGLLSVRYSLNAGDPVLAKRVFSWNPISMACSMNATTLGYTEDCGSRVRTYYNSAGPWLTPYPMKPMKSHSFVCYAGHPVLRQMLADIGVETRTSAYPTADPPNTCRNG